MVRKNPITDSRQSSHEKHCRLTLFLSHSLIDGKHVVFGQVVDGMDVVRAVEKIGSESGKTRKKVKVADCGQL